MTRKGSSKGLGSASYRRTLGGTFTLHLYCYLQGNLKCCLLSHLTLKGPVNKRAALGFLVQNIVDLAIVDTPLVQVEGHQDLHPLSLGAQVPQGRS